MSINIYNPHIIFTWFKPLKMPSTPLGNFNNAHTLVVHGGCCKGISKFTHLHLLYSSSILPHPRGYLETC